MESKVFWGVFFKVVSNFPNFSLNETRVCLCVCVCVCPSQAIHRTLLVIITKLGTVTASDILMHHVLIVLTLTVIRVQTDLDHENNKCSIISETVQAMPITFAVKIG